MFHFCMQIQIEHSEIQHDITFPVCTLSVNHSESDNMLCCNLFTVIRSFILISIKPGSVSPTSLGKKLIQAVRIGEQHTLATVGFNSASQSHLQHKQMAIHQNEMSFSI